MNPQFQPGQPPQQPAPQQVPPQAGAAPEAPVDEGADDGQSVIQRVGNTEFNQQMQNILLSRIDEEGTKDPNFGGAIDQALSQNPAAAIELALVVPELIPILRIMGALPEGAGQGGPIGQAGPQQAPGQPPAGGPQFAAPKQEAAGDAEGGYAAGEEGGSAEEDEDEEEENPILGNGGVSSGLMG